MDKTMRTSLIIGGVLAGVALLLSFKNKVSLKKYLDPKVEDPQLHKNFNFDIIPDGKGNYRAAQLTENELAYVIKKYGIKRIIRMNGDGSDSKHRSSYPETSRLVEKNVCKQKGCEYHFINAHSGYVRGKGYTKSASDVIKVLNQGNTLIHCAHGADRTGGMVGAYLKNTGVMTNNEQLWAYTTKYNGWESMIKRKTFYGSGYDKYADSFYPIDELKRNHP
jgi:hypothetical protein